MGPRGAVAGLLLLPAGCASTPQTPDPPVSTPAVNAAVTQDARPEVLGTLAIPQFGVRTARPGAPTVVAPDGSGMTETFVTGMMARGYQVVERSALERVMSERRLAQTGVVDPSRIQDLGQLAGAEVIVLDHP